MFPAHAGMNRIRILEARIEIYVPRTRGDEPDGKIEKIDDDLCSPHTRG